MLPSFWSADPNKATIMDEARSNTHGGCFVCISLLRDHIDIRPFINTFAGCVLLVEVESGAVEDVYLRAAQLRKKQHLFLGGIFPP
jgi:hypothetical protein